MLFYVHSKNILATTVSNNKNEKQNIPKVIHLRNAEDFYNECMEVTKINCICKYVYVVFDLDDFKVINKMYGYDTGDTVLNFVGNILENFIKEDEVVGRIDSDIFNLLLLKDEPEKLHIRLNNLAEKVKSFNYLGIKLIPSIGVYCIQESDKNEDIASIGTNAYLARKSIKGDSTETIAYYDSTFIKNILTNQRLIYNFSEAIENKDFKVYYQGKNALKDGKTIGAEALVRWNFGGKELITPGSFIELFEYSGDIIELDLYIFETVCSDLRNWVLKYGKEVKQFKISINVSRRTLMQENIVEILTDIARKYKISPKHLEIELTETFFLQDKTTMKEIISGLKKKGFKISVDDFGSGYSAFTILKDLKVDVLKIDKSFLDSEKVGVKSRSILGSIIDLSSELGLETIAEGVETKEQSSFLKKIGCNYAQGYYYYRPEDSKTFEETVIKPFVDDINAQKLDTSNRSEE